MLIRGPVGRVVLGMACSHVRWHEPPITSRSPCRCCSRSDLPPPRGRSAKTLVAPKHTIATMVSSVLLLPMLSPCQATLSSPLRYRHRPAVVKGSPSSPPYVSLSRLRICLSIG